MQEEYMGKESELSISLVTPTLPRWWRVLPSLILLVMISYMDSLILNDFIEYRYTTQYQVNSSSTPNTRELCLNDSQTSQSSTTTSMYTTTSSKYSTTTTISPSDRVQSATARLNVFIALCSTIPAILTSVLLGSNCDRIGRKPLITLPYVGKIIRYTLLTATAYYGLPDIWIVLAAMFDSFFGTAGLSILSSFAYVSDCTKEKARTRAIIITEVCMGGSKFIPLLAMGIYLQNPNFTQSMVFTLLISLAGFVFCIILQPESNLNVQHLNIFKQLGKTKLSEITKIFRVFLVKREGHKQRSLLMLISAQLSIIVMAIGPLAINYLYLYGPPFCFDSFGVSLTSVASTVTMVTLTIIYTLAMPKHSDHLGLPIFGCCTYITQLVLYGIANKVWMIYVAGCLGALFNVLMPVIRSRITKLVEPNEYAVVFILASIFESGGSYAINAMSNEIYRASLEFYSGLVYFVFAMFGALAIFLMSILHILEYRSLLVKKTVVLND